MRTLGKSGMRNTVVFGTRFAVIALLTVPAGADPDVVRARVLDAGVQIAGGLGPYRTRSVRIGHMGDIRMEDVERTMDALEGATDIRTGD